MPTYDYQCNNCGHEFEVFQSMTAGVLKKCPQCGQLSLKRLIGTGGAVIFKGSGFYSTDYRSESYQKQAKAETEKQNGSGGKSESNSSESSSKKDKTPASKTEKNGKKE